MKLVFSDNAWQDYLYWQKKDSKILRRINSLIRDIQRNGHEGLGKPEALRNNLSGYWSRRITQEHRLIHKITDDSIFIAQLRYHY